MSDLRELKHVHIVGICGTLMGAFAAFLKRSGVRVTGSDQNVYPPMSDVLRNAGIEIYAPFAAENLRKSGSTPDLVVVGNVVRPDNPEARAAIDQGLRYTSLPEAMETFILPHTRNLVVAGTHGKTTTSSMLTHVLRAAGKDPGFFIGGVAADLPVSFHVAETPRGVFVLEGDEYDTAFWDKVPKFNHYLPNDVILTSVEYDHADIYPSLEHVVKAFEGLMTRVRAGGRVIACLDYPNVARVVEVARARGVPVISYGASEGADGGAKPGTDRCRYRPGRVRVEGELTHFDVLDAGKPVDSLTLSIAGGHNVVNALAVWIQCRELGLDADAIRAALRSFRGVKRRQEERGEPRGILVIDDFAHHPTAVRETLKTLRARYPGRRLLAVFEPRSATSRRKIFQQEYAEAFAHADEVFIAQPHDQSSIASADQFSSQQLVDDIRARIRGAAELMPNVDDGVKRLAGAARPGDLVAVMSNGGFGGFIQKLLTQLA